MQSPAPINPYAAPHTDEASVQTPPEGSDRLPRYVKGWAIASIVICVLRIPVALWSLGMLSEVPAENPVYPVIVLQTVTNMAMVVIGLIGNILILRGSSASVWFCWMYAAVVATNIASGAWGGVLTYELTEEKLRIFTLIGVTVSLLFRAVLLVSYCVAIARASAWFARRSEAERPVTFTV